MRRRVLDSFCPWSPLGRGNTLFLCPWLPGGSEGADSMSWSPLNFSMTQKTRSQRSWGQGSQSHPLPRLNPMEGGSEHCRQLGVNSRPTPIYQPASPKQTDRQGSCPNRPVYLATVAERAGQWLFTLLPSPNTVTLTHTHTHTHANQCSWVSVLKAAQGKGDQEENPSSNRKKRKERKTHEGKY